jgi:putative ABC transport system ATP-binding protein
LLPDARIDKLPMKFRFNQVVPFFINDTQTLQSDVWGKELMFENEKSYLIKAASGTGKSTLLGILFGVRNNFKGDVFVDETNSRKLSLNDWSSLRQHKISLLFQELRLFENLTVKENLQLKLNLQSELSMKDAEEYLRVLGMSDFINRTCKTLSWGQQQRIAIVRSLLQPFECLMMDEPFSHLDEKNTSIALTLIRERCTAQHASLILSSLGSEHGSSFDHILNL